MVQNTCNPIQSLVIGTPAYLFTLLGSAMLGSRNELTMGEVKDTQMNSIQNLISNVKIFKTIMIKTYHYAQRLQCGHSSMLKI